MANRLKDYWTITPMALTELINQKRSEVNKTPIDHLSMKTHLILKTNVAHPGVFDFEASELKLDAKRMEILQGLVNDQFGIYIQKLSRHCTFHPVSATVKKPAPQPTVESSDTQQQNEGVMSKLGRLFGRE